MILWTSLLQIHGNQNGKFLPPPPSIQVSFDCTPENAGWEILESDVKLVHPPPTNNKILRSFNLSVSSIQPQTCAVLEATASVNLLTVLKEIDAFRGVDVISPHKLWCKIKRAAALVKLFNVLHCLYILPSEIKKLLTYKLTKPTPRYALVWSLYFILGCTVRVDWLICRAIDVPTSRTFEVFSKFSKIQIKLNFICSRPIALATTL